MIFLPASRYINSEFCRCLYRKKKRFFTDRHLVQEAFFLFFLSAQTYKNGHFTATERYETDFYGFSTALVVLDLPMDFFKGIFVTRRSNIISQIKIGSQSIF